MQFSFSDEQRTFQTSMRTFLEHECTPQQIRALWESDTGRSKERWSRLADMGLLGVLVPERQGGLGMDEIDLVLLLEETGRAALPSPSSTRPPSACRCSPASRAPRWPTSGSAVSRRATRSSPSATAPTRSSPTRTSPTCSSCSTTTSCTRCRAPASSSSGSRATTRRAACSA
jgi:hypothetical protein